MHTLKEQVYGKIDVDDAFDAPPIEEIRETALKAITDAGLLGETDSIKPDDNTK